MPRQPAEQPGHKAVRSPWGIFDGPFHSTLLSRLGTYCFQGYVPRWPNALRLFQFLGELVHRSTIEDTRSQRVQRDRIAHQTHRFLDSPGNLFEFLLEEG